MKLSNTYFTSFAFVAGLALSLSTSGCDRSAANGAGTSAPVVTPPAPAAKPKVEPTAARLAQRVTEVWSKKASKDWVETYDYLGPEMKKTMPIGAYLQNKESHEYVNPVVNEVMKIEKNFGFVRLGVTWTPRHPQLKNVKLEPGQTLTEDIEIIETWSFVDGDWYQARSAQSPDEFFADHPEFLKAPEKASEKAPEKATEKAPEKATEKAPDQAKASDPK